MPPSLRRSGLVLAAAPVVTGCENPWTDSGDGLPPEFLILTEQLRDTAVNDFRQGIVGEVRDPDGVARITVQVNAAAAQEVPIVPAPSVLFDAGAALEFSLEDGRANSVRVRAYDRAGNVGEWLALENVLADSTRPRLDLVTRDSTVTSSRIRVQGRISSSAPSTRGCRGRRWRSRSRPSAAPARSPRGWRSPARSTSSRRRTAGGATPWESSARAAPRVRRRRRWVPWQAGTASPS